MKAFFVTIPHSGEQVPADVTWLKALPEPILMCDVDRFVDRLYAPALETLKIPAIVSQWHRYVVDLNRLPQDVDQSSVIGAKEPAGAFATGFHWVRTTTGQTLMPQPMPLELHRSLSEKYFAPFHQQVENAFADFRGRGFQKIYHLDAHSMPSKGTKAHRDPGQERPQIVVSDFEGKSCEAHFKDLVMDSYREAGFEVAYNWPYIGGRLTQTYGCPERGQHTLQVEMNRSLYMDEFSKQIVPAKSEQVQDQLQKALSRILKGL